MNSTEAFGNIAGTGDVDAASAGVDPHMRSAAFSHAGIDLGAMFPVNAKSITAFVVSISTELFAHLGLAHDDFMMQHGVAHVSYILDGALDVWTKEACLSQQVLLEAYHARASFSAPGKFISLRNLSLMCVDMPSLGVMEARFIHWQSAPRKGRPISLDSENRIKALVCVGELREAMGLESATMVHPDVGVAMLCQGPC